MQTTLTIQQFSELLSTYGTELARWPAAERAAAEHLVSTSAEARALLAAEAPVDALLDPGSDTAPDGLLDRILQATEKK